MFIDKSAITMFISRLFVLHFKLILNIRYSYRTIYEDLRVLRFCQVVNQNYIYLKLITFKISPKHNFCVEIMIIMVMIP